MPKVHQVIPFDLQNQTRQRPTSAQRPRSAQRTDHPARPSSANATKRESSGTSTVHYFQQFSETKRFVQRMLHQEKHEKHVSDELMTIGDLLGAEMVPNVSSSPSRESARSAWPSRNVEIHHGINSRAYTLEDREHYHAALFSQERSSPDKSFDEEKATRKKKVPKKMKVKVLDLKGEEPDIFPEWISVRNRHMTKLEEVVKSVVGRASGPETTQQRREFLGLAAMIQQITLKIVEFYLDHREEFQARVGVDGFVKDHTDKFDESLLNISLLRWQELEQYIEQLPTCLNWLEENPFRLWTGLHFTLNPLWSCYDVHGDLAVVLNDTMHHVLQSRTKTAALLFEPEEENDAHGPPFVPEVMAVIARELRYDEKYHRRLVRANAGLKQIYEGTVRRWKEEQAIQHRLLRKQAADRQVSVDIARYNRLTFLLFGCDRQEQLDRTAEIISSRRAGFMQQQFFHLWQRVQYYGVAIRYMAQRRRVRIFHWVCKGVQIKKQQKERLRALYRRSQHHLLEITWAQWQKNRVWWKLLDHLRSQSQKSHLAHILETWKEFIRAQRQHRLDCLWPLLQHHVQQETESTSLRSLRRASQSAYPDEPASVDSFLTSSQKWLRASYANIQALWMTPSARLVIEALSDGAESVASSTPPNAEEAAILLAGGRLRTKWVFQRWYKLIRMHRALRLWTSASEGYKRREAFERWRDFVREDRFQDRVRQRTVEMLREAQLLRENSGLSAEDEVGDDGTMTRRLSRAVTRRLSLWQQAQGDDHVWTQEDMVSAIKFLQLQMGALSNNGPVPKSPQSPSNRRKSRAGVSFAPDTFPGTPSSLFRRSVSSISGQDEEDSDDDDDDREGEYTSFNLLPKRVIPPDYVPAYSLSQVPVVYRRRRNVSVEEEAEDPVDVFLRQWKREREEAAAKAQAELEAESAARAQAKQEQEAATRAQAEAEAAARAHAEQARQTITLPSLPDPAVDVPQPQASAANDLMSHEATHSSAPSVSNGDPAATAVSQQPEQPLREQPAVGEQPMQETVDTSTATGSAPDLTSDPLSSGSLPTDETIASSKRSEKTAHAGQVDTAPPSSNDRQQKPGDDETNSSVIAMVPTIEEVSPPDTKLDTNLHERATERDAEISQTSDTASKDTQGAGDHPSPEVAQQHLDRHVLKSFVQEWVRCCLLCGVELVEQLQAHHAQAADSGNDHTEEESTTSSTGDEKDEEEDDVPQYIIVPAEPTVEPDEHAPAAVEPNLSLIEHEEEADEENDDHSEASSVSNESVAEKEDMPTENVTSNQTEQRDYLSLPLRSSLSINHIQADPDRNADHGSVTTLEEDIVHSARSVEVTPREPVELTGSPQRDAIVVEEEDDECDSDTHGQPDGVASEQQQDDAVTPQQETAQIHENGESANNSADSMDNRDTLDNKSMEVTTTSSDSPTLPDQSLPVDTSSPAAPSTDSPGQSALSPSLGGSRKRSASVTRRRVSWAFEDEIQVIPSRDQLLEAKEDAQVPQQSIYEMHAAVVAAWGQPAPVDSDVTEEAPHSHEETHQDNTNHASNDSLLALGLGEEEAEDVAVHEPVAEESAVMSTAPKVHSWRNAPVETDNSAPPQSSVDLTNSDWFVRAFEEEQEPVGADQPVAEELNEESEPLQAKEKVKPTKKKKKKRVKKAEEDVIDEDQGDEGDQSRPEQRRRPSLWSRASGVLSTIFS